MLAAQHVRDVGDAKVVRTVTLEELAYGEQLKLLAASRVVILAHGAAVSQTAVMEAGGLVLEVSKRSQ